MGQLFSFLSVIQNTEFPDGIINTPGINKWLIQCSSSASDIEHKLINDVYLDRLKPCLLYKHSKSRGRVLGTLSYKATDPWQCSRWQGRAVLAVQCGYQRALLTSLHPALLLLRGCCELSVSVPAEIPAPSFPQHPFTSQCAPQTPWLLSSLVSPFALHRTVLYYNRDQLSLCAPTTWCSLNWGAEDKPDLSKHAAH